MTDHYNIYRGLGGIEGIDWSNPVAQIPTGYESVTFSQDLPPGRLYVFAARAVSSSGLEECNTHVVAYVEADSQGNLLPAPLARPTDVTVEVLQTSLLICLSYRAPVGFAEADGFDILSDNGAGQLDLENPAATIEVNEHDRFDFQVAIDRPDYALLLAARARQGERTGPLSEVRFVPQPPAPAPALIL